jgi:flagellar biosynthesis/type III secretory pathway protein FliH
MRIEKFIFKDFSASNENNDISNLDSEKDIDQTTHNIDDNKANIITPEEDNSHYHDINTIKNEEYNRGYNDAMILMNNVVESMQLEIDFKKILESKISELSRNLDDELHSIVQMLCEITRKFASRLYKEISSNFEQIFHHNIENYLKNHLKDGEIEIYIHPDRSDIVESVIEQFRENKNVKIKVITSNSFGVNDCKVDWQKGYLKYDENIMAQVVDEMLSSVANIQK